MGWGPRIAVCGFAACLGGCNPLSQAMDEGGGGGDDSSGAVVMTGTSAADDGATSSTPNPDGTGSASAEGDTASVDDATSQGDSSADGVTTMGDASTTGGGSESDGGATTIMETTDTGGCVPSGSGNWVDCNAGDSCGGGGYCYEIPMSGYGGCGWTCDSECDCPPSPGTGTATVGCQDFGQGAACYLDCQDGKTCPDGMSCYGISCQFDTNMGGDSGSGSSAGPYEACTAGTQFACDSGSVCVHDSSTNPNYSTCMPTDCNMDSDCPDPAMGTVHCGDATGGPGNPECFISCAGGLNCPSGYSCISGFVCMQDYPV